MDKAVWEKLAKRIRRDSILSSTTAGSGHPTSSLSATDLMTVLFFKYLRYDLDNPQSAANDRVIFSKGHASPLFYSLYAATGKISSEELLLYRTIESPLEGHPTRRFAFTEAATGSLGQGLSIGAGEALALKMQFGTDVESWDKLPRVYVLLGDGETVEGSVWEAAAFASFNKLNNLVAVLDVNRLGQSGPTMYEHDTSVYRKKFEAFGWGVIVIDGHNFSEIDTAYQKALDYKNGPVVIVAKTVKGKGVSFLEDKNGWHGRALSSDEREKALAELGQVEDLTGSVDKPDATFTQQAVYKKETKFTPTQYGSGEKVATRKAFGNAVAILGKLYSSLLVLDGDVQNSTYTEEFRKTFPDRFVQCYIAEQNMIGVATGLSARGYQPVVSTFACFLTRAYDQIRMASHSGITLRLNGSHGGVSIGQDGPSQMGLEDIAMMRAVGGSTVLYPCDPYQTEYLVSAMMDGEGIFYIRTTREATPVIYNNDETFPIGGSKVFYSSSEARSTLSSRLSASNDKKITIVAAGITVHEALKAQKQLAERGIAIRVIDCYSVKPIDEKTIRKAAKETAGIVVVEDHYPEGGLGEAVRSALPDSKIAIRHLAVRKSPRSGKPGELFEYEGISSASIVKEIESMVV